MISEKIIKLSDRELSKVSGTGSLEGEDFLEGILNPVHAVYVLITGRLHDEEESRFLAAGVLGSYVLAIGATLYLRYTLPKFYKKIKNAIK